MTASRQPPATRAARWTGLATRLAFLAAALVVAGGVLLGAAAPAYAHAVLLRTEPADGAVVTTPVREVTLTYNENVRQQFTTVVVAGADGTRYSRGPATVTDTSIRQEVTALASGAYTVAWRTVSADGHAIQGSFGFRVDLPGETASPGTGDPEGSGPAGAGPGAPDPATTGSGGSDEGGSGVLWWVGGAAVAVAAAAVALPVALRRRPRPARGADPGGGAGGPGGGAGDPGGGAGDPGGGAGGPSGGAGGGAGDPGGGAPGRADG